MAYEVEDFDDLMTGHFHLEYLREKEINGGFQNLQLNMLGESQGIFLAVKFLTTGEAQMGLCLNIGLMVINTIFRTDLASPLSLSCLQRSGDQLEDRLACEGYIVSHVQG